VDNEDHDIRIYSGGNLTLENSIVARRNTDGKLFGNDGLFNSDHVLWYHSGLSGPPLGLSLTDLWRDPQFVNGAGGNYHLKETSPALNFASGAATSPRDLDGHNRLIGVRSDLGAYEFQSIPRPQLDGLANGDTVSGVIFVQPNRTTYPSVLLVDYYLDGVKIYSTKSKPFTLGGSVGYDTSQVKKGTHLLTAEIKVSKKETRRTSVAFIV